MSFPISDNDSIKYSCYSPEFEPSRSLLTSLITWLIPTFLGERFVRDFLLTRKLLCGTCDHSFDLIWNHPIEDLPELAEMVNWAPIAHQEGDLLNGFKRLRESFETHPLELTTPDGINLVGTLFQNRYHQENDVTTVIYFCGYGENYRTSSNIGLLLEGAMRYEKPINLIAFDYRGCLESQKAKLDSSAIILDGLTLYKFAAEGLNIVQQKICLYGFSLGGAVAHGIRHELEEEFCGKAISDRSFSSYKKAVRCAIQFACERFLLLEKEELINHLYQLTGIYVLAYIAAFCVMVVQTIIGFIHYIGLPLIKGFSAIIACLGSLYVDLFNCELNVIENWSTQHRLLIIEHQDDPIILPLARLSQAVELTASTHLKVHLREEFSSCKINNHCTPLNYHIAEDGSDPLKSILDFITDD